MSDFFNLSRRKFIWGFSCTCGSTILLTSCAEVAMSDRKQIKIFSDEYLYSKFVLVDDDQTKNAWCMPGGKIAFYTGIMPIAKNDDGIASIMGHEIAHAVARHSAERMSTALLVDAGTYALERFILGEPLPGFSRQLRTYGLDLPFNRKQESEADYLGIIFSNLAGYNINESYKIWERMQEASGQGPAEFFSTHPSPENRIKKLKDWIPDVKSKYPSIKT